ncbi:MAG: hypothetical protein ACODAU_07190 [Myxococcota bacterium]
MRDHRLVVICALSLGLAACDGCGADDEAAEETSEEAAEQAPAEEAPAEEAPAEEAEPEERIPDSPHLGFTVEGGDLDGKAFDIDVADAVAYWLFDPKGKNTMIAARGKEHDHDAYFYAAVPLKETGAYEFRPGASGADTRVQIRMRAEGEERAFAYLAHEGELVLETQVDDWLVGTFQGKFIRSEKMGADLKDIPEEKRDYVTIRDGKFAVTWKDRMGGKATRWE